MATNAGSSGFKKWQMQDAAGIHDLCADLSFAGRVVLDRIPRMIDEVAPTPGLVVYVTAKKLAIPLNGLNPVLFSAIDVNTHLQVSRAYLAPTTAAAVSFIEFAARKFPFKISLIRTQAQPPFRRMSGSDTSRDFSKLIGREGYVHSIIEERSRDALFSITSGLQFGGVADDTLVYALPQELHRELEQFLFFHNNYRPIPWLDGKTPVQKLRMFSQFTAIHTFSQEEGRDADRQG